MTMKPETRFTLPDRNEIANALVSVSGEGHAVQNLYPKIMDLAGTQQAPTGFVFFLTIEVSDYVTGLHLTPVQRTAAHAIFSLRYHQYGRALIKDETALNEFLDVLAQVGMPTGREAKRS
jgi:hypothetical protein